MINMNKLEKKLKLELQTVVLEGNMLRSLIRNIPITGTAPNEREPDRI